MRRERLVAFLGGGVLTALALAAEAPVRNAALAARSVSSTGWDAAAHALLGLDLYDDLARLRPGDFLAALVSEHWWPPLFGLVSLPFQWLAGPSFASASLPSAVAFALAPAAAWLVVRRLTAAGVPESLLALVLVAALFLRSPMLLEMSTWPMFESLGGLLALVAWLFFADRGDARSLKIAAGLGALLFFLKYHYGFFALATFGVVLFLDEPREARRELRRAAVDLLVRPAPFAAAGLLAILWIGRVLSEASHRGPPAWLPSRGNLCYAAFLLLLAWGGLERHRTRALLTALGPSLRAFGRWGLLAPAAWLLIPANVRAWYRQTIQTHPDPERNPLRQLAAFLSFLKDEYTWNVPDALPLVLVALGLAAALATARSRDRTAAAMAAFSLWPVLLMSLSTWRVEARYLGVLAPSLFAVSVAGLLFLVARVRPSVRSAAALLLAAGLIVFTARGGAGFDAEMAGRAPYRFPNRPEEAAFIDAMRRSLPAAGRVGVALPEEPRIAPALRLGLRLDRRALLPGDVLVGHESPAKLLSRLRDRGAGRAAIAVAASAVPLLQGAPGWTVVEEFPGPALPGPGNRAMAVLLADAGP
jgi:hypothetical protein